VRLDYARQFGAGGYVGRASGRPFNARRALAYAATRFKIVIVGRRSGRFARSRLPAVTS
jgi:hypothetical protein